MAITHPGKTKINIDSLSSEVSLNTPIFTDPEQQARAIRMSYGLQSSLDLSEVLQHFTQGVREWLPSVHVSYQNQDYDISIEIGQQELNFSTYDLVVEKQNLGQLNISRSSAFSEDELGQLEDLLTLLIFPLRNALQHTKALLEAQKDPLTGINNRSTFDSRLRREISFAKRHELPLALLTLDLDHFKEVNDNFGHSVGDCVLQNAAEAIVDCVRESDLVFRFGGDEFVVILSSTSPLGAQQLAERIGKTIQNKECICSGKPFEITASIGIAVYQDGDTHTELFDRADAALYRAKQEGRNCTAN